jgi:hypothetical protein
LVQQLNLLTAFLKPLLFSPHCFPESGSYLFAGTFFHCFFHIDKKLNVNNTLQRYVFLSKLQKNSRLFSNPIPRTNAEKEHQASSTARAAKRKHQTSFTSAQRAWPRVMQHSVPV